MDVHEPITVRSQIVVNKKTIKQIKHIQYLGYNMAYEYSKDVEQ